MMRTKRALLFALVLMMGFSLGRPSIVFGDDKKKEDPTNFTVKAIPSDHQIDKSKSYFDVMGKPNEEIILRYKIANNSGVKQTYLISVNSASTNKNGLINYKVNNKEKSLPVSLSEITEVPKEVTIPAVSDKEVAVKVKLPADPFQGVLVGAIHTRLKEEVKNTDGSAMSVKNTYGYIIGIVVTESENQPLSKGEKLELKSVENKIDIGKKVFHANLLNPQSAIFEPLAITATITGKNGGEAIATKEIENGRIAPHSVLPLELDWGAGVLAAGDYKYKIHAQSNDEEWTFEDSFTITQEEAKKLNKEADVQVRVPQIWWKAFYGVSAVTGLSLVFMCLRAIRRKRS